ncbi:MAG TPA: glycosyltransferase family 2 protein [Pyrinomonadaceae bacterium]|nr:glycosyltransferase family 2 protein [Pyrinomonadaceae bacterium]
MSLKQITPVVLTFNEEANLRRNLDSLRWAQRIVILDSGSTDQTEAIARSYSNVTWHSRRFDSFRSQWEHAIQQTGVTTEYVLALDADMEVSTKLLEEIAGAFLKSHYDGGLMPIDYRYYGRSLAGSICPPQIRIVQRNAVKVTQLNHGHKFAVAGPVYRFRNRLIHDDRKSLERWIESQLRYQKENEAELANGHRGRARDYARRLGLMPPIIGLLAYLRAGGPFKGAAAARYAYERMTSESILAVRLMDARLQRTEVGGQRSEVRDLDDRIS